MSEKQEKKARLGDVFGVDQVKAASFMEQVSTAAFIEELANNGVQVESQEQLDQLIKMSYMIDEAAQKENSTASLVKSASAQLEAALGLGKTSADKEANAAYDAEFAKCAQAAVDPEVAKLVLSAIDYAHPETE